ncbi:MAG: NADH-quinone oxidoreductase subunit C, partial [Gammaproteobacteria bacterium]|nr:NADH-quinone oxidoreductase subunit C [Gammaproteobacteria bacterium]
MEALRQRLGPDVQIQHTVDGIPNLWVPRNRLLEVMGGLKDDYPLLFDLSAVDERVRSNRDGLPDADFTVFYHLISLERNSDVRIKVALSEGDSSLPSLTSVWPAANWYEREAYDMFGVKFDGHPNLYRILTPALWEGHPLRKEHPARATEMDPFRMTDELLDAQQESLRFKPEEWGMSRGAKHTDFMFLNLGPNHPSVHGVFRIALQLDGPQAVDAVPDTAYHH